MDVIVNHDARAREFLLDFFAHFIQYPGQIPGICPVFRGDEGTGKNIIFDAVFGKILGADKYFTRAQPTPEIFSRFSAGRLNKVLIVIDEATGKDSCANSEVMKEAITAERHNHEDKGVKAFSVQNFNRFVILSNSTNSVKLDASSRRYFLVDTSSEKVADKAYFDKIHRVCKLRVQPTRVL